MLIINGKPSEAVGRTLLDYLQQAGLDPARVAVELDGEIVPRDRYRDTLLCEGQKVEIVRFVGGG